MADQEKPLTNAMAISKFFELTPASVALKEIKALTAEDKEQLGEGIRNGTLTY